MSWWSEILPEGKKGVQPVLFILLGSAAIVLIEFTFVVSASVYLFGGELSPYMSVGVYALMLASMIPSLATAVWGSNPVSICGARGAMVPILAAMIAGTGALVLATGKEEQVLPTILATLAIGTILTGGLLYLLGHFRFGNMIRAIPYPVMGGFFAGVGYLFVAGGLSVMTGESFSWFSIWSLVQPASLLLWLPGLLMGVTIFTAQRVRDHWAIFPLVVFVSTLLFYAVLWKSGVSLEEARAAGFLINIGERSSVLPPVSLGDFAHVNWMIVATQAGVFTVLFAVNAIAMLLDASGIELMTRKELSLDKDLKVAGLANVANGLVGGAPGVHSVANTALPYKLGGGCRLVPLSYALFSGLALLAGPLAVAVAPLPVLGGLLVYVGMGFLYEWLIQSRAKITRLDYFIVLVILACVALVGILEGVALGMMTAILLFAYNYGRLNVIKFAFPGNEVETHVDRPPEHEKLLKQHGASIQIYILQGYLFFGTANSLLEAIRARVEDRKSPPLRYLLLDFRMVEGMDISVAQSLEKVLMLAENNQFEVIFSDVGEATYPTLACMEFMQGDDIQVNVFEELSRAGSWCQDELLLSVGAEPVRPTSLETMLGEVAANESSLANLVSFFQIRHLKPGEQLFQQNDMADALYILLSGRIEIVGEWEGKRRRLRDLAPGSLFGEIALYTEDQRSADAIAISDSSVASLSTEAWEELRKESPQDAEGLHVYVVQMLSNRLKFTNQRLLRALS